MASNDLKLEKLQKQGWVAGAGQSRVFLAPWSQSRSRLKKKNEEPESLGKKVMRQSISRLLSPVRRCIRKLYSRYSKTLK